MQGNFFQNKEILNGWKEIMFIENGSTEHNLVRFYIKMESRPCHKSVYPEGKSHLLLFEDLNSLYFR